MKLWKNVLGVILVVMSIVICTPIKAEEEPVVKENPLKLVLNENGHLEVRASAPSDEIDFLFKIMYCFMDDYGLDVEKINISDMSEDFKSIKMTIDSGKVAPEWVDIDYIYDETVEQKVNEALESFRNLGTSTSSRFGYSLRISDLEMIHHYYYSDKYDFTITKNDDDNDQIINFINSFSSKIKADINNQNLNLRLMAFTIENGNLLKGESVGAISAFKYNDSIYYIDQNGIKFDLSHVFYVSSDTPNRAEDIKASAQKRINDYLNNEKVKIDYIAEDIRTVEDYLSLNQINEENITEYFENNYRISDVTKDDFIYKVTISLDKEEKVFYMIIKRDSEKMVSSFQSVDLVSGIEVSTSKTLTLDTLLSVSKLTSGTEYERIIGLLGLTDSVTYDIKLFSKLENKYITKLEDGTFEVKIPIPEELVGKDLTAYYVDENGKIETFEVTIKDGYAIFKTNHFSIYTLGETRVITPNEENNTPVVTPTTDNKTVENPNTSDNIVNSILLLSISLVGLVTTIIISRKYL